MNKMEEIKNLIYTHSSPNGCVALTRKERARLLALIKVIDDEREVALENWNTVLDERNENAELSNSVTELANSKIELENKVTELEKQIEKMKFKKCCGNCSEYYCSKDGKGRCNFKNPSFTVCGFNICERWRSVT